MIVDNVDSTYGVRFYDNDVAERLVTVDKFVPGYRNHPLNFAQKHSGATTATLVHKT